MMIIISNENLVFKCGHEPDFSVDSAGLWNIVQNMKW